jgi:glycosyltransferase involved in cell wall biosynthesis
MPPRVSVLMTTWNGAAGIAASIASILGQSFTDFELVVVDDGSTDGTAAILAGIADPRLVVLRPPRNLGIVGARNLGFAVCRGNTWRRSTMTTSAIRSAWRGRWRIWSVTRAWCCSALASRSKRAAGSAPRTIRLG